jgi:hypothetical protein
MHCIVSLYKKSGVSFLPLPNRCPEGFLGEYCQHRDPCEKNRCQNGGTCVAQAMLGKATCRCAPGFTGEECQYSTSHPCFASRPCLNGGTCHMLSRDTYECTCQVGFTGNKWDPCSYFPTLGRHLYFASLYLDVWLLSVPIRHSPYLPFESFKGHRRRKKKG